MLFIFKIKYFQEVNMNPTRIRLILEALESAIERNILTRREVIIECYHLKIIQECQLEAEWCVWSNNNQ